MFDFGQLVVYVVKSRNLGVGVIIGLGIVFNKQGIDYGFVIVEGGVGYLCIVEVCMIEII